MLDPRVTPLATASIEGVGMGVPGEVDVVLGAVIEERHVQHGGMVGSLGVSTHSAAAESLQPQHNLKYKSSY